MIHPRTRPSEGANVREGLRVEGRGVKVEGRGSRVEASKFLVIPSEARRRPRGALATRGDLLFSRVARSTAALPSALERLLTHKP